MRALVTGAAGFIGSHLVDALLDAGYVVDALDDLSRGHRELVSEGAAFHHMDVLDGELQALMAARRPDVVFHHAAQIDLRRSVSEPVLDTRVNVVGTVNLLEACARAGVRRVVFASSGGAVYGDTEVIPTTEAHPCAPASPYGAAKLAAEQYGEVFSRLHGIEVVSLRYSNVYGPRQDPHGEAGVVAIFAQHLLAGDDAVINGDGLQTRDYVFVADVVAANLRAAEAPAAGAFNIGTGRECDVNTMYALVAGAVGTDRPARRAEAKPGEQRRSCLATERAADCLGWEPAVSLEVGISRTVDWFAAQRHQ